MLVVRCSSASGRCRRRQHFVTIQQRSGPAQSSATAIDIALEPDQAMLERAGAVNARLRGVYPAGFALDAVHHPHVTLLQQFVGTADLVPRAINSFH
jgi:hypothetical protein